MPGECLGGREHAIEAQDGEGVGGAGVGEGVAGIARDRLLEVLETAPKVHFTPPVPELAPLEIERVRLEIVRRGLDQRRPLRAEQGDLELARDRARDLILYREDVGRVAIE